MKVFSYSLRAKFSQLLCQCSGAVGDEGGVGSAGDEANAQIVVPFIFFGIEEKDSYRFFGLLGGFDRFLNGLFEFRVIELTENAELHRQVGGTDE